jgi:hypothetical protein
LINVADLASGNDGNGTGSDPTTAPGAIVNVEEEAMVGIRAFYSQPTTDPPADGATLDLDVEVSVDGGTVWGDLVKFRQVLGSELPDDEAAGDKTLRMGWVGKLPRADAGQANLVKLRPVTIASTTTDWGLFVDVCSAADVRSEWTKNNVVQ